MTFTFEVTRPDDLLRLRIEARNLKRDGPDGEPSVPVVDDLAQPAYLIVVFPPQAIGESAYFEATVVTGVSADVPPGQIEPPLPTTIDPLPPGEVDARMAHRSRLVFRVPAQVSIPLTIEGLLDWSSLEPSVNPIAAIGPRPSPAEIAQAPAIARPAETETVLELPYKLIVSPNKSVRWAHRLRRRLQPPSSFRQAQSEPLSTPQPSDTSWKPRNVDPWR
jgi:hypothetical protein